MKYDKILSMLDTPEDIAELKKLLEEEIRKDLALKTNPKSRVSNIAKMEKEIEKLNMANILGCGQTDDGRFVFTNGFEVFILNDSCGFEPREDYPKVRISGIDTKQNVPENILNDMLYNIKIKKNYKWDEDYTYNYKYLDCVLKVIGDADIYFIPDKGKLYFINKDGEEGLLLAIKK